MTTKYKCIKYDCHFFFSTDEFAKCQITQKYINDNSYCDGIEEAKNKAEEYAGKISKLLNEYNKLIELESYVKSNQKNIL
jgi:hypothetical protein